MALDAALQAQGCDSRNLAVTGDWEWLLQEFATLYGIRQTYAVLAHLRWVVRCVWLECLQATSSIHMADGSRSFVSCRPFPSDECWQTCCFKLTVPWSYPDACACAGLRMQPQQRAAWSCWVLSWNLSSGPKERKACFSR